MTKKLDFDLQDFLPFMLNQAAEASSLGFQTYYKSTYGMLRTEWRVVFHLGRYGDLTAKAICDRARLHKTKVSRAVAALEGRGILSRQTDQSDRRQEDLTLTPRGQKVFEDLYSAAKRFDEDLTRDLSTDEQDILRKCLAKFAKF